MRPDTLAALHRLGAPMQRIDATTTDCWSGGRGDPDLTHISAWCAQRNQATARSAITLAALRPGGPQCEACWSRPPASLFWLGEAEAFLRVPYELATLVDALPTTAWPCPPETVLTLHQLARRLAVARVVLFEPGSILPQEIHAWAAGIITDATDALLGCREMLRADTRWLSARPVGPLHYLRVAKPSGTQDTPDIVRKVTGVFSSLGETTSLHTTLMFPAPHTCLEQMLDGSSGVTWAGEVGSGDPAELPAVALRLVRDAAPRSPLRDPAAAVHAARAILAGPQPAHPAPPLPRR